MGYRPPDTDTFFSAMVLCTVLSLGAKPLLCIAYRQSGDMPPRKVGDFRSSEIDFAAIQEVDHAMPTATIFWQNF